MESTAAAAPAARPDDPHQRITLLEILGYIGIAAGLFGTVVVLAETSGDTNATVTATSAVLTVVFLVAGAMIGEDAPDRLARLRSACWFASTVAFFVFLGFLVEPTDKGGIVLVSAVAAVYALILWAFSPRLLQQLAFYNFALTAIAILIGLPDFSSFFFGPPDLTALGLTYWVGGGFWFALGTLDLVRPPRTAMVLGLLAALQGPLFLLEKSPELAAILVLGTSAACLAVGGSKGDRAVTGVAVVGLLIGTVALLAALEVEGTGPGLATMIVGVAFLAAAVIAARGMGTAGRPAFGRFRSPFGRPRPPSAPAPPPPAPPTHGGP